MLELLGLQRLHVGPIHLKLDAGRCLAITGRSGTGKSILLRMVADLDPHAGDATLDGEACSRMPAPAWRHCVSYVAADSGWWLERVGAHFPAGSDAAALFPRVGIPAAAVDWPVVRLSTGERQRLALLRALQPGNRVLLLDEPTSGLDPESTGQVEDLLRERMAQGVAVLMVTHDPEQPARMGARTYAMAEGRLEEVNA